MARSEYIKQALDNHFLHVTEVAVSTPTPELWRTLTPQLGPQARFGWSWPISNDPGVLVPYCPEIIDEQTVHLTDDELEEYLRVIKWVSDHHIILWFEVPDPVERQRRCESDLYTGFPYSLKVWSRIQFAALGAPTAEELRR